MDANSTAQAMIEIAKIQADMYTDIAGAIALAVVGVAYFWWMTKGV